VAILVALSLAASRAIAADALALLPGEVRLTGPTSSQRLLVVSMLDGVAAGDVREGTEWSSSDENIVKVTGGVAMPVANGAARITVRAGDAQAETTVRVDGMDAPHEWTLRNDVLPVFAKAGCNSGACHGALAGKGGLKLSLRGYDPLADHLAITRQARGRRVELADPGRSLILAKPTGALPHKGGVRLEVDSPEYEAVAGWISQGAGPPTDDDARVERIEVLPAQSLLKPGDRQQVLVLAHYDDGRTVDVTRLAKYASTNEVVCQVDPDGAIRVTGHGEGAVTAWYASKIVIARVTSPYDNVVPAQAFADAPRRNFIDKLVLEKLESLRLPPSPRAGDAEFLRRVFLDTIGTLPTEEEARAFLADQRSDKRDRLIESLLARPEFVDYWTYKWSDLLLINGQRLRPQAVEAYYRWIRERVEKNVPWDELVRQIVTAKGSSYENGATNFFALHQDAETMTENVCQAFLGLSIGCARCHNHPLEKWTNDQYYAMANLFSRVRAKGWGGDPRNGDGLRTLYVAHSGELVQPLTGKPQPPTPLDGKPLPFDSTADRRVPLADWLTSPDNPYFSRAIANRVWANYFGVGLVESVDDLRLSNPASNDALLEAAAQHLVDNRFDLKPLMRTILQSETYQRTSQPLPGNAGERRFYSRYYPRRMMAEVLLDAYSQVTGVASTFNQIEFPGADFRKIDDYPAGTRALQLYDSAVVSYFLKAFGRNTRAITCECERSNEPSMVQVLHLSNGDTVNQKLAATENRLAELIKAGKSNEEIVEVAFLSALSRFPTDEEKKQLLAELDAQQDIERRVLIEDLYWGILSSREFLFHH
jgi:hypothetical protein